ncbi:sporulation protein YunB [Caldicellulosiruptor kronotskyensis 2002]|uniref:Sporulation protein YunB n=1 Tax=Caldicellulosiruptor kronotskyensis (strain DSM 18902 / VKM B-2412 / 2002) TaxID=632348 RepID=E4SH49_CALK2|nr:sporulation protein YunB [Caldicellulosiruptor kronotskyensis]ADQ47074.1 sporulation protein YunB [Caldicellulosiruptor kronotskyensis 2002]
MRFYNYNRRRCQKALVLLAFLIFALFTLAIFIEIWLENYLIEAFEYRAKQKIVEVTNQAVLQVLQQQKIKYDDVVKVEKGEKPSLIKIDTVVLNKEAANLILLINQKAKTLTPVEVEFRLGYIFNNIFFNQFGPVLRGNIMYISAVSYNWQSDFNSAGINQTVHRIYLNLKFEGHFLFLRTKRKVTLLQRIPIAENIYIGEVPKVYIGK